MMLESASGRPRVFPIRSAPPRIAVIAQSPSKAASPPGHCRRASNASGLISIRMAGFTLARKFRAPARQRASLPSTSSFTKTRPQPVRLKQVVQARQMHARGVWPSQPREAGCRRETGRGTRHVQPRRSRAIAARDVVNDKAGAGEFERAPDQIRQTGCGSWTNHQAVRPTNCAAVTANDPIAPTFANVSPGRRNRFQDARQPALKLAGPPERRGSLRSDENRPALEVRRSADSARAMRGTQMMARSSGRPPRVAALRRAVRANIR